MLPQEEEDPKSQAGSGVMRKSSRNHPRRSPDYDGPECPPKDAGSTWKINTAVTHLGWTASGYKMIRKQIEDHARQIKIYSKSEMDSNEYQKLVDICIDHGSTHAFVKTRCLADGNALEKQMASSVVQDVFKKMKQTYKVNFKHALQRGCDITQPPWDYLSEWTKYL